MKNLRSFIPACIVLAPGSEVAEETHKNPKPQGQTLFGSALDAATAVTLAPVVADDCQNTGVAGAAFPSVVEAVRATGRTRLVLMGGTQERNARAVRFYLREGFAPHGRFEHPPGTWNIDMTRAV
ncbi:MAG: GNAT family N-acetyltransferase [Opitutae bacterium]|nr:GNAT family N-acetyltransferase [Opitutae bacterium]